MHAVPFGTKLGPADVIGRKLIEIRQSFEINERDLALATTFYSLNSSAVFALPFEDAGGFLCEEPPADAEPIEHLLLDKVLGQTIVRVLRVPLDADYLHEAPYLLLDNDFVVTDIMGAPAATGHAGVWIYAPEELDTSGLIEFFH